MTSDPQEQTNHPSDLFDGVQFDPQFALGLKSFLGKNAIYGFASGLNATVNDSSETLIANTLSLLQGMQYDGSTGTFTISTPGVYLILGVIGWDNHTGYHEGRVKKNGSVLYFDYFYSDPQPTKVIALAPLLANDTIQLYGWQQTGFASHTPSNTYLALVKL